MNSDIKITVKGTQIDPEGEKFTETTNQTGRFYKKNNVSYVICEDELSAQTARYKFNHRYLEVVKNGDVNAKLYFEASKEYSTVYRTRYGNMLLTFKTQTYSVIESEDKINLCAKYDIYDANGGFVSENIIEVIIDNNSL